MRPGIITKAIDFAEAAHAGQVSKYTGTDYYLHPVAVVLLVLEVSASYTQEMLVAAALHDTVEDTDVTLLEIEQEFGRTVSDYVYWLTDQSVPENGNRATRKAIDRAHIARAPADVKTIKLADLIHNTKSIVEHDPKFAKVYMAEKLLLLDVLMEGDAALYKMASDQVTAYTGAL